MDVKFERPLYQQYQLRQDYLYGKKKSKRQSWIKSCLDCKPADLLRRTIPLLVWLPEYKWRQDFTSDLVAGITVAIMHISQGMAYAMLAKVPPVVGIYTAFFPVFIYIILGESKHNSMGSYSIVCLMIGKVVIEQSHSEYTPEDILICITFLCGVYQVIMYVCRLGIVSTLLSEPLVSGFTTGSVFYVLASQVKEIFGVVTKEEDGYFTNLIMLKNILLSLGSTNYFCLGISTVTITISILFNEVIKEKVARKTKIPIPLELILLVVATLCSGYLDLNEKYRVNIVGDVPKGLSNFKIPQFGLIKIIWLDSLVISLVSYTTTLSMGLIFAQKLNYQIDANQELLAIGISNIFGSFSSCLPVTASLSRSSIQESVGGKTQMVSAVSCALLVIVLLWISPYFKHLPLCVLASIIVVALKSMLWQFKDFFAYLSMSKMDGAVWITTFSVVTFVDIDIGLLVGFAMSLLRIFISDLKPYTCLLGHVPNTELYLDNKRYKAVNGFSNLKIFHYQGSLNFISTHLFKKELCRKIEVMPVEQFILRQNVEQILEQKKTSNKLKDICQWNHKVDRLRERIVSLKYVILDFSAVTYIDYSGVMMLCRLFKEFERISINIFICSCSEPVYEMILKCGTTKEDNELPRFFPTVHDAVRFTNDGDTFKFIRSL